MRSLLVLSLCALVLGGVPAEAQSLDSIMSALSSAYQSYQSGQMVSTARDYVRQGIDLLNRLQSAVQNMEQPTTPQPPSGQGRSGAAPPMPPMPPMPQMPQMPRPQWPWVMPPPGK